MMDNKHEWNIESENFRTCIKCGLKALTMTYQVYNGGEDYTHFYHAENVDDDGFIPCRELQIKNFIE
jgi:hypothetical protein